MTFELTVLAIILLASALGYLVARLIMPPSAQPSTPVVAQRSPAPLFLLAAGIIWFLLAIGTRHYSETDLPGWAVADWFAHRGKWFSFAAVMLFMMGITIYEQRMRPTLKGIIAALIPTTLVIVLTIWRTLPVYRVLPPDWQRDQYGFMRQSVYLTCGPVSLGNLMEEGYGIPAPNERELARLSGTTREGTTIRGLQRAASQLGIAFEPARVLAPGEIRNLSSPAIIAISTVPAVRHAIVVLDGDDEFARVIDPEYGHGHIAWAKLEEIQYGKTLIARLRED